MVEVYIERDKTFFHGTIIDFESIGTFDKQYLDHRSLFGIKPIIFGFITNTGLEIHYVTDENYFEDLCLCIDEKLDELTGPFWAFNKTFEQGLIYNHLDRHVNFKELNAKKFESKRVAVKKLGIQNHDDPFNGNGRLVVDNFPDNIDACVKHNRACLLKETEIWRYRYGCEFTFG